MSDNHPHSCQRAEQSRAETQRPAHAGRPHKSRASCAYIRARPAAKSGHGRRRRGRVRAAAAACNQTGERPTCGGRRPRRSSQHVAPMSRAGPDRPPRHTKGHARRQAGDTQHKAGAPQRQAGHLAGRARLQHRGNMPAAATGAGGRPAPGAARLSPGRARPTGGRAQHAMQRACIAQVQAVPHAPARAISLPPAYVIVGGMGMRTPGSASHNPRP